MNNLIMITKHFPYNHGETPGETFLDQEISVLSEMFKNIYVIAVEAKKKVRPIRLPKNVHAYAIGGENIYIKRVSEISGAALRLFTGSSELKKETAGKSLENRLFAGYFDKRAHDIADKAYELLKYKDLSGNIYIYSYWFYYHAQAAVLLKQKFQYRNVKCFSRAHRYDLYEEESKRGYIPYREYLLENLDAIFPCSQDGTDYLLKKYGDRYGNKIHICYLGTEDHGESRPSKDGSFTIVSCSRIVPVKRVMDIAKTIKCLDERMNVTWIHFGGGKKLDEIKSYAESKIHNAKCVFMGTVPNDKVLEYYSRNPIDLLINLSESEGLPISIMEAVSFGIPVVATDVGGTSEIVINGKTGHLVDKDYDIESVADTVASVLGSEDYIEMRSACRSEWEKKFKYRENTRNMIKTVQEV